MVIDGSAADTLLGKPVQSAIGEDMGRIVDVVTDRAGVMRAVIIDFGGFLGVGSRKIAVDWRVLHFPPGGAMDKVVAQLQRNQLRSAPVFKPGEPIVVVGRAEAVSPPAAPPAAQPVPAAPSAAGVSASPAASSSAPAPQAVPGAPPAAAAPASDPSPKP